MNNHEPILLKLSGMLFADRATLLSTVEQIKSLRSKYHLGIVVGGGNFFRGSQQGKQLGLRQPAADAVGMLATNMNGIIMRDLLDSAEVPCILMSACPMPGVIDPINTTALYASRANGTVVIFAGGSGNPFFTTDTTAVMRALQMGAKTVWKATNVDGIYDADPANNPQAKKLNAVSYDSFIEKKLRIMDLTAITMAAEHSVRIRVFNLFAPNALLAVAKDETVGSTISSID